MAYKLAQFSAEIFDHGDGRSAVMIRQEGSKRIWLPKSQIKRKELVGGTGLPTGDPQEVGGSEEN